MSMFYISIKPHIPTLFIYTKKIMLLSQPKLIEKHD